MLEKLSYLMYAGKYTLIFILSRTFRYNYELGWANSKTFIKQLAKDNIDPSLLNEELQRHAENRRRRR